MVQAHLEALKVLSVMLRTFFVWVMLAGGVVMVPSVAACRWLVIPASLGAMATAVMAMVINLLAMVIGLLVMAVDSRTVCSGA